MPDREKVIAALERCMEAGCDGCPYDGKCAQRDFALNRDIIELLKEQRWISVEDRLPENDDTVLLVKQLKSGQKQIGLGYCIIDYHWTDPITQEHTIGPRWVCGGNNNVIYWQPLPEIPKE